MYKVVTVVQRAVALGNDAFSAQYLGQIAQLVSGGGGLLRCIANLVDLSPAPPHDAVVETWWDALESHAQLEHLHARAPQLVAGALSYHVREVVQKEYARTWPVGERSPGIKGIYAVTRRPGLTREAFARHWQDVHGPLALAHHVGMSKYVQDVVLRPLTPGAPDFDGFSELHFPTAADMRERFIDSPEGGRRIEQDVAKFVGSAVRLDSSEYVLLP